MSALDWWATEGVAVFFDTNLLVRSTAHPGLFSGALHTVVDTRPLQFTSAAKRYRGRLTPIFKAGFSGRVLRSGSQIGLSGSQHPTYHIDVIGHLRDQVIHRIKTLHRPDLLDELHAHIGAVQV